MSQLIETVESIGYGARLPQPAVVGEPDPAEVHAAGLRRRLLVAAVLGVPVESHALKGMDSLLSIVQMPGGIPVGTLAIGKAGAKNAALFAVQILSLSDSALNEKLKTFRLDQSNKVLEKDAAL